MHFKDITDDLSYGKEQLIVSEVVSQDKDLIEISLSTQGSITLNKEEVDLLVHKLQCWMHCLKKD